EEVLKRVENYPSNLVEITGGEPLLQKAIHNLVRALLDLGKRVLIETGGHHDISEVDNRVTLVYDIKCPGSGMSEKNYWSNLKHLRPQDEIKFVLASRQDYDWAKEIVDSHGLSIKHTVLFSPVSKSLPPAELAGWMLQDGLPVRLQLQMHKILWGDKRGV
ncbi:MAG: 7-carboxy-7-deazaguanine synthase QueE, partial [bacterium]